MACAEMSPSRSATVTKSAFCRSSRISVAMKTPRWPNTRDGPCDACAVKSGVLPLNDKHENYGYKEGMNEALSRRLSQTQFADPMQEALLSLLVAANTLNDLMDELCESHRITRPQYNVMRILRGVHPQGHARCEIARRMIDRSPDVTRLVDRLQA